MVGRSRRVGPRPQPAHPVPRRLRRYGEDALAAAEPAAVANDAEATGGGGCAEAAAAAVAARLASLGFHNE